MSTTGKTPISLLNETLIRRGYQPIYQLKQDAVGTNQGLFMYEVSAGDLFSASGCGRSKKEAKQQAAKAALETMRLGGVATPEPVIDDDGDVEMNVVSPYEAELKVNAVGTLSELCANHEMPPPEYVQIREDGPPHAKFFEFTCKVASVEAFAVGRTKKQAKQLAASYMLRNLELNLSDLKVKPVVDISDLISNVPPPSLLPVEISAIRNPLGLKVGQGLRHDWTKENLVTLQSYKGPFEDPLKTLTEICAELKLDLEVKEVESNDSGPFALIAAQTLVLLSISTLPEHILMGYGASQDEAVTMAADQAITFLQLMTR